MIQHMRTVPDTLSADNAELAPHAGTGYLCPLAQIPPAQFLNPSSASAVLFSAPHAGRYYATEMFAADQLAAASTLEEKGTDVIVQTLSEHGYPALIPNISRAVVDLNRPSFAQDSKLHNILDMGDSGKASLYKSYISAGYGVIPRLDAQRRPLHKGMLESALVTDILVLHHTPYHQSLAGMIHHASSHNSQILLCDIHSMPDDHSNRHLPDILFGNLHGVTCSQQTVNKIEQYMSQSGLSWAWNTPYAGGYITRHYGLNSAIEDCHVQAVQIEINRAMLETQHRQTDMDGLKQITEQLAGLSQTLADSLG